MTTQIKLRRDSAADWTSNNPTLAEGEFGLELDTGKLKWGDGATAWASLPYFPTGVLLATDTFAGDTEGLYNALVTYQASQDFSFTADSTITSVGTLSDYALGVISVLRWNGASALTLDSIANGTDGRVLFIMNVTAAQTLTLDHDTGGTAANRIVCPGAEDFILAAGNAALLMYDSTATRWKVIGAQSVATHAAAADPHTGYRLESADHTHASSGLQAGTIDHGALTGLTDDDHTQYRLESESGTFTVGGVIDGGGSVITAGAWIVWRVPFACTVTAVHAQVDTGTTTVVNAGKGFVGGTTEFCSADITIDPADAWEAGAVNQNQSLVAGDAVYLEVVTAGTATLCTIQVTLTRP